MSRRASFFARQNPGQRRVRFPDEVIFDECVKDSDPETVVSMLRRVSVDIDVNRINMAGMTALHQAVLDDNMTMVQLLVSHGANVNILDTDTWTPLHAAAANGHHDIVRYLIENGGDKDALTDEGETPCDLVDTHDYETMAVLLNTKIDNVRRKISLSLPTLATPKIEPAWVRRESIQEEKEKMTPNLQNSASTNKNLDKANKPKHWEMIEKSSKIELTHKNNENLANFKCKKSVIETTAGDGQKKDAATEEPGQKRSITRSNSCETKPDQVQHGEENSTKPISEVKKLEQSLHQMERKRV